MSERLSRVIERLREERGLSSEELASRSGVEPDELRAFLRAECEIGLDALYRLAGALEVTPKRLLEGIEWIPDGRGGGRFSVEEAEEA